jgi:AraC-like DNA-binding protein
MAKLLTRRLKTTLRSALKPAPSEKHWQVVGQRRLEKAREQLEHLLLKHLSPAVLLLRRGLRL